MSFSYIRHTLAHTLVTALLVLLSLFATASTRGDAMETGEDVMKILFLHHSTGQNIWDGGVPVCIDRYNLDNGTDYRIEERIFPKRSPYGWNNYPFDYWNIWVAHSGAEPYLEEPTLEMLTEQYDVIVFKHCFPVSDILEDTGNPDIASDAKRLENYKLQYEALKAKMHEFPGTKFIVWTAPPRVEITSLRAKIAALLKGRSAQRENGERARAFAEWVRDEWDQPGDNIFVWDFHEIATGGGIFLPREHAVGPSNSHPNESFSARAAELLCHRIVDVIEGRGDTGNATGE